jgi:hypothetical protein
VTEWILAFDAGCGRCNEVIDGIINVAGERLSVAGLGEDRIRALRQQALGEHPPFAPTLLAVDADRVRAWTGPRLTARLSLLLGLKRSVAVARSLNRMDVIVHGDRRRFLKAAPGVALGVFLLSGGVAAPAMAATGRRSTWAEAQEWVVKLDRLPTGYDEIVAEPVVRRRALFVALPQETKIDLWHEHLRRFELARPELSAEQSAVLSEAATIVPAVLGAATTSDAHAAVHQLEEKAVAVLGSTNTFDAFAMLGPADPEAAAVGCFCSVGSLCSRPSGHNCHRIANCAVTSGGCGCFWAWPCDGDFCQD